MSPSMFENIHAFSLSLSSHEVTSLSEFPDSRTFYNENRRALPTGISGFIYLATCNRVELYVDSELSKAELARTLGENFAVLERFFRNEPLNYNGSAAIEHVISVASGLKSLALGETQITGQLKRDIAHAEAAGFLGGSIGHISRKILEIQKNIRTSTAISRNSYSLLSLVESTLKERGIQTLKGEAQRVALIGASQMSAKVARFAIRRGIKQFILLRKETSAAMNDEMTSILKEHPSFFSIVSYETALSGLAEPVHFVFAASTGARPVLTEKMLMALGGGIAIPVIDLAMPANADADVIGYLKNSYISIESLRRASDSARHERIESAAEATPIIRRAIYQLWLDSLYRKNTDLVQTYIGQKADETRAEWVALAAEADLSERQKRMMYDFIKKEQRRSLARHREMILDLIAR